MNGLEITDIKFKPVKDRATKGKSELVARANVTINDMIVINDICIFEYGSNKSGFSGFSSIPFTEYDRQSVRFTSQELDRKINHEILDAYVDFKNNGISESHRPHGRMMRENTEDYNTELFDSDGEFHGEIPEECVRDCTHPGPVDDDVEEWVKRLDFRVPREPAIEYLKYEGAWDDEELNAMSNERLSRTILWMACCDIAENEDMGEEDYYWYGMRR